MEMIFVELGFGILVATIFGILAKILKQPLVIAYIIAGFVIAPYFFGSKQGQELMSLFSTIGIAFLLFIVGMEMKTDKIKAIGRRAVIAGTLQVLITFVLGSLVAIFLGFDLVLSIYIGIVLSFSSTVIVVNLLSEKKALSSLYGRMAIGILILQDIFALGVLVVLSGMKANIGASSMDIFGLFLKVALAFAFIYISSKLVIKPLFKYLAHSTDMLFLSSIAWCFAISGLAVLLGFSVEMGAFLAGVSLANLPYSEEISFKLSPLRDFFLILFFVALGMQTDWANVYTLAPTLIVLALFVLIIKPIIVMTILGRMGFTKRTSFYSGVSLGQTSEFSILICAIGFSLGYFGNDIVALITLLTVITILFSSYLITFLGNIYNFIQNGLGILEKSDIEKEEIPQYKNHIVIFGYHRIGKQLFSVLEKETKKIIVVDLDPDVIDELNHKGRVCVYGDAYDTELLEKLNIKKAKMVLVTFPAIKSNEFLIKTIKSSNPKVRIITVAERRSEALSLYKSGADYVILPHYLGAEKMISMLDEINKKKRGFGNIKKEHIISLGKINI